TKTAGTSLGERGGRMKRAMAMLAMAASIACGAELTPRRADGLVARGALRHVHPLGPPLRPGRRMEGSRLTARRWAAPAEWIMLSAAIPKDEYAALAPVQSVKFDPRAFERRQRCRYEVHGHQRQTPRRLQHVRHENDQVQHCGRH